jgi:hypothetical protein
MSNTTVPSSDVKLRTVFVPILGLALVLTSVTVSSQGARASRHDGNDPASRSEQEEDPTVAVGPPCAPL